jgi:hypothetical protein
MRYANATSMQTRLAEPIPNQRGRGERHRSHQSVISVRGLFITKVSCGLAPSPPIPEKVWPVRTSRKCVQYGFPAGRVQLENDTTADSTVLAAIVGSSVTVFSFLLRFLYAVCQNFLAFVLRIIKGRPLWAGTIPIGTRKVVQHRFMPRGFPLGLK